MPKIQGDLQEDAGGRRRRGRRITSSLSEINVVPLVDVMLVMLIIFMVTAPMMQRGIEVTLPESRRAQALDAERLFVTVPLTFREDRRVMVGEESVGVDVLAERIRQALLTRSDKQVYLRGDGAVQYQELVTVWDELKAAGVDNIGMVTDLPRQLRQP